LKTAIVVLNYNDSENTIKFVNCIFHYNIIDKIVVVDNFSNKVGEFEKLSKLKNIDDVSKEKIDIIKTDKNGGYAYGNNYGLKFIDKEYKEKFDYVIISNPDVKIEEEDIRKTIDFMQKNTNVAIASPRMKFVTGLARRAAWKKRTFLIDVANSTRITEFLLYPLLKKGEYSKKDYGQAYLKVQNIAGSFFIASHDIFKKVGYFDENTFLFFEEDILGEKLAKEGYDIYLLNESYFLHYESQSIGKIMNLYKKMDILFDSRIYYQKKYNNVGQVGILLFYILKNVRKIELLIEIPIRKIIKKMKSKDN
jgi:GT2 family glycosyltransferase